MFRLTAPLIVFALILNAGSAKAEDPEGNSSVKASPGVRAEPWNEARRAKATPMPLPNVDPETVKKPSEEKPELERQGAAQQEGPAASTPQSERQSGNTQQAPLIWAGRLFFHTPNGDMVCSAQFIRPRVVLTAAHCVQDQQTGTYYSNFNFYLQYNKGRYSRNYDWDCVGTKNGWVSEGFHWDYAMIRVRGTTATGHFGWRAGWQGLYNNLVIIGYPLDIAQGEVIQVESGPAKVEENGLVQIKKSDPKFGPGSSGGAWIGDYTTRNKANYVLSVMSFGYTGTPEYAYGPYFDVGFKDLLDYVERGCK